MCGATEGERGDSSRGMFSRGMLAFGLLTFNPSWYPVAQAWAMTPRSPSQSVVFSGASGRGCIYST